MQPFINENAEKLIDCLIILKKFNESFKEVLTAQYGEEIAGDVTNERRYTDACQTLISYLETHIGRSIVFNYLNK